MHDIVVVEEFRDQGISHLLLHEVQNMALEKKRCNFGFMQNRYSDYLTCAGLVHRIRAFFRMQKVEVSEKD